MNDFELDFLLNIDEAGLITASGSGADLECIKEWLSTSVGSVYGNPSWGNEINKYRHSPQSIMTEISIESSILKIRNDIENMSNINVHCKTLSKDQYAIIINTKSGIVNQIVAV